MERRAADGRLPAALGWTAAAGNSMRRVDAPANATAADGSKKQQAESFDDSEWEGCKKVAIICWIREGEEFDLMGVAYSSWLKAKDIFKKC
jgi:hypothetical protein